MRAPFISRRRHEEAIQSLRWLSDETNAVAARKIGEAREEIASLRLEVTNLRRENVGQRNENATLRGQLLAAQHALARPG